MRPKITPLHSVQPEQAKRLDIHAPHDSGIFLVYSRPPSPISNCMLPKIWHGGRPPELYS